MKLIGTSFYTIIMYTSKMFVSENVIKFDPNGWNSIFFGLQMLRDVFATTFAVMTVVVVLWLKINLEVKKE